MNPVYEYVLNIDASHFVLQQAIHHLNAQTAIIVLPFLQICTFICTFAYFHI
jgi:hypothetical protein